jgi:hypothetical protein
MQKIIDEYWTIDTAMDNMHRQIREVLEQNLNDDENSDSAN